MISFDGQEVDYLIIGSGPAGSLIASELSKRENVKVLLIDAGDFVKPGSIKTEYNSEFMESFNQRKTVSGSISIRNGRVIGGGSTVNIDLAFSPLLPSIKNNLTQWIKQGQLPHDFVHTSNNNFKVIEQAYAWVKQTIGTRSLCSDEINANNSLLLTGYSSAKPYDLNAKKSNGNPNDLLKISAVDAYLWPALNQNSHSLQVISNLNVVELKQRYNNITEVIVKSNQSSVKNYTFNDPHGLQLNPSKTYTIKTKNIILCAGTLGSAEVLLRSNMPNSNIGKGIIMHPSIGVLGIFDRPIRNLYGISATIYAPSIPLADNYFFEAMSAEPAFIASIHPGSSSDIKRNLKDFHNIGGFGILLVDTPSNDNLIFIDGNSDVQVDYTLSKKDKKRFRKAILTAIKILFEQGAKEVFIPSMELIYKNPHRRYFISYAEAKKAIDLNSGLKLHHN
ncbi:MAG: GMC family oxidoreductase N-terminal domain-containing protein [Pseudomonadota bacterium]